MPSPKSSPKPSPEPTHQWSFESIGTQWWIGIYEPIEDDRLRKIVSDVQMRIEHFDATYSRFREDSLVTRIARQEGVYQFPPDANALFTFYRQLYDVTSGAVTPLIGGLMADVGYDASYSLQPKTIRAVPAWDSAISFEANTLTTETLVELDFGAAGKGYLIDLLQQVLRDNAVRSFVIDGSGDMVTHGLAGLLQVGMEDPRDASKAIGIVDLQTGALCASSPSHRAWEGYHHIMNPHSQQSVRDVQAVWVTAETCMQADGLATALFFVEPAVLANRFTFEYCVVYADSSMSRSSGFPATIFTERTYK